MSPVPLSKGIVTYTAYAVSTSIAARIISAAILVFYLFLYINELLINLLQ